MATTLNDFAGLEDQIRMVQYDLTRQLTRQIAAKASHVQARADLVAPLASLSGSLGAQDYAGAGEAFPSALVELLGDPAQVQELDAWLARNNGFPGATSAERAQWEALLHDAGYSVAQKIPVFLQTRTSVFTPGGENLSTEVTNELVWMDQAQRNHLGETMSPNEDVNYEVDGVSPLLSSRVDPVEDGNTLIFITAAWCLDRGAGPCMSEQDFNDLLDSVVATLDDLGTGLGDDNARLRLQNADLVLLLEDGDRMLKQIRERREISQEGIVDEDRSRAERAQILQQYQDRKNAQPTQAGGHAPVPGSMRTAPFPTTTPTPPALAPEPEAGDSPLLPRQPTV
jgi:hypothetical protein